jgi:hypothetical protein
MAQQELQGLKSAISAHQQADATHAAQDEALVRTVEQLNAQIERQQRQQQQQQQLLQLRALLLVQPPQLLLLPLLSLLQLLPHL